MNTIPIEYPAPFPDYSLLDSGNGEKLERFTGYTIIRPDPRAIWQPKKDLSFWQKADARFVRTSSEFGSWQIKKQPPAPWTFHFKELLFLLKPTDFKHVGIFPEQAVNWQWLTDTIAGRKCDVLNLFGYTGAATMAAAKAGAFVTHVDSSKPSISWARENNRLNDIPPDRVRWMEDDAGKFVIREERRAKTYDGVILDPPRFGRGPKGQVWKLTDDLPKLLTAIKTITSSKTQFILLSVYTADLSALAIYNLMESIFGDRGGTLTVSELATKESDTDRLLPQGIVARWTRLNYS